MILLVVVALYSWGTLTGSLNPVALRTWTTVFVAIVVAASLREFSLTARLVFLVVGPAVDVKLIAMQRGCSTASPRPASPLAFAVAMICAVLVAAARRTSTRSSSAAEGRRQDGPQWPWPVRGRSWRAAGRSLTARTSSLAPLRSPAM